MTPTRAVWLVARRELQQGVRNRVLRITFVTMLLLIVAGAFLPTLFSDEQSTVLGMAGDLGVSADEVIAAGYAVDLNIEVVDLDAASVRSAVDDGEVDAALTGDGDGPVLVVEQTADPAMQALLADLLAQRSLQAAFDDAGVDAQVLAEARAGVPQLVVDAIDEPEDPGGFALAFGGTILLFFGVAFFASRVLSGVVEEKSSRVVEVVLGAVRPRDLLAGKLVGIGLLGLGQIVVLVIVAVVSLSVSGTLELPSAAGATVAGFLGWFVLGFATYSAVFAAAGALVPRIEDAQSSAGPINTLMFIAYFSTILIVVPSPDGLAAQIVSQIPGIAPFAMPARIALGAVTAFETIVAVVISIAATYGAIRLAGVIYQRSVLRTQKATWREMLARPRS